MSLSSMLTLLGANQDTPSCLQNITNSDTNWMEQTSAQPVRNAVSSSHELPCGDSKTYADLQPATYLPSAPAVQGSTDYYTTAQQPHKSVLVDAMMSLANQEITGQELLDFDNVQFPEVEALHNKQLDEDLAATQAPLTPRDALTDSPNEPSFFPVKVETDDSSDSSSAGNIPYGLLDAMETSEHQVPRRRKRKVNVQDELSGDEMAQHFFPQPDRKLQLAMVTVDEAARVARVCGAAGGDIPKEKAHRSAIYTFRFLLYLLTSANPRLKQMVTWMDVDTATDQPTDYALFKVMDRDGVVQCWSNGSEKNCETIMKNTWGNFTTRMRYTRGEKNYGYFGSVTDISRGQSKCPRKRMFCFGEQITPYLNQLRTDPEGLNDELEESLPGFPDNLFNDKLPRENLKK